MAIVLSLVSALAYGVSDFLGGIFAKRSGPWQIAVVGQSSSTVCALALLLVFRSDPTVGDWVDGGIAGLGGGLGVAFLYRGLSTARMSVVAPLSAIGSALLPVAVGLLTGDRPSALAFVGIVLALPAIALISRVEDVPDAPTNNGVFDGVAAGLGFGVLFVFLGLAGEDAGMVPLFASQVTSVVTVVVTAMLLRQAWRPDRDALRAVVMGPLGAGAQGAFLYATHHGLLSVVSVIASLYPASTVVLAAVLLRERILRWQSVGLVLAALAISLVAYGTA